jgi:RNA methyltransferase, TrmH family
MQTITSRHNPLYKTLQAFKKDKGVMLLEGRRLVEDALSRGMSPRLLAITQDYPFAQSPQTKHYIVLSENLFNGIAETESPQGILAFFDTPWSGISDIAGEDRIIILDSLQDPGNVGTIIRTAEAFGFSGIILVGDVANPFSPKAIRASMGSCLGIKIARGSIGDLKALPHRILALALQGKTKLSSNLFKSQTAICLGQESGGISREIIDLSHDTVYIPMAGRTESLNVAVTAGIVMALASGLL